MNLLYHLHRTGVLRPDAALADAELLTRYVHSRDEHAFTALVLRHGRMVWGVCRRVLGCAAAAEDAFQATFLVLARKASTITPRNAVGPWLHGVARTTALKARASDRARQTRERAAGQRPRSEVTPDAEMLALLDEEVARLPEKYRLPIVLCELEGRPLREVAAELGWPPGTVAGRLARARHLLAARLGRRGVGLPTVVLAPLPAGLVEGVLGAGTVAAPVADLVEGVLTTMLMTKIKRAVVGVGLLALLALAASTAAGQFGGLTPKAGSTENPALTAKLQPLQGIWRMVGARWDEQFERVPALRSSFLTIQGHEVRWREGEFTLSLPAGTEPKRLDLKATSDGIGVRTGETLAFVYAVEGDTLRLAYRDGGGARPTTLDPLPGSGCVLLEFKRGPAVPVPVVAEHHIIRLRNVAAAEVAQTLGEVFDRKRVNIVADPRTNTLLIQGSAADLAAIRALVEKTLDAEKPRTP